MTFPLYYSFELVLFLNYFSDSFSLYILWSNSFYFKTFQSYFFREFGPCFCLVCCNFSSPNHLFLVSSFVQNFCSWHIIFHVWLLIFYGFYFHFRFLKINSTLSGFYLLIYSCFPIYIQNYVVMNFPFLPFSLFLS